MWSRRRTAPEPANLCATYCQSPSQSNTIRTESITFRENVMSTRLTRKGQVTIPKRIRDLLGLQAGSPVVFKVTEDGQVLFTPADTQHPPSRFAALRGVATVKMSTDEIMALTRGEG